MIKNREIYIYIYLHAIFIFKERGYCQANLFNSTHIMLALQIIIRHNYYRCYFHETYLIITNDIKLGKWACLLLTFIIKV